MGSWPGCPLVRCPVSPGVVLPLPLLIKGVPTAANLWGDSGPGAVPTQLRPTCTAPWWPEHLPQRNVHFSQPEQGRKRRARGYKKVCFFPTSRLLPSTPIQAVVSADLVGCKGRTLVGPCPLPAFKGSTPRKPLLKPASALSAAPCVCHIVYTVETGRPDHSQAV